jgi:hypothetical protein
MSKITISISHHLGRLLSVVASDDDFQIEIEPQGLTGVDYKISGNKLLFEGFELKFSKSIPWYGSKSFTGLIINYYELVELINFCMKKLWYMQEATEPIFTKFERGDEITLFDLGCDEFEPKKKIVDKRQLSLFSY